MFNVYISIYIQYFNNKTYFIIYYDIYFIRQICVKTPMVINYIFGWLVLDKTKYVFYNSLAIYRVSILLENAC